MALAVLLIAVAGLAALSCIDAGTQQLGVKGKLICPSEPNKVKKVKIWLVDKDLGWDDSVAKMKTGADGVFAVNGTAFDLAGSVDLQLKIYHQCLVGALKGVFCDRRLAFKLPDGYLTSASEGKDKMNIIDMGIINLEPEAKKEDSCNWGIIAG